MSAPRLLCTVGAMTCDDLTTAQIKQVGRVVGHYHRYLGLLTDRMQKLGFSPKYKVYAAAQKALDATHTL